MGKRYSSNRTRQNAVKNVRVGGNFSIGNITQNIHSGSVVAILTTVVSLGSGFLIYQLLPKQPETAPGNSQSGEITLPNSSSEKSTTQAEASNVGIEPGQLVQPALGNRALVELTAVRRIPGEPDKVSVEMRFKRHTDDARNTSNFRYGTSSPFSGNFGSGYTNVSSTTARNPITSETYRAFNPFNQTSGGVSLREIHDGQPVEGYVVLDVPSGVNAIDIFIPNAGPFKNVPISNANQVAGGANRSFKALANRLNDSP